MNIAFVGAGKMGSGMARSLLRAGHALAVYNRTREKAEALAGDGARVADSPASACEGAEAVVTMLSDDAALSEAVYGANGIAGALPGGAIHVSSSTVSTRLVRDLAEVHARSGQAFVSAPVFGRPEVAEAGKLLVVAAGDAQTLERCRPILDAVGRETIVAGPHPWQANAVKLSGNFMIAAMTEGFSEVFAMLRKADISQQVFVQAMDGLFASPIYANYGRIISEERFSPAGFALKLGAKDMRLALETARECEAPMPLASLLHDRFLAAMARGQSELDWTSVAKIAALDAGL